MRTGTSLVLIAASAVLTGLPAVAVAGPASADGTSSGTLYLVATDGSHGFELWRSDGTEAGTSMVKDIRQGPRDGLDQFGNNGFTDGAGTLYFWANDGTHGLELWRSDGSEAGTGLVSDIWPGPHGSGRCCRLAAVVLGSKLYFVANDGAHGRELWTSDGTAGGTVMLKNIRHGSRGSGPYSLTIVGDSLLFGARDRTHGFELWRSDGTRGGTALVEDIAPGEDDAYLGYFAPMGTTLYFAAFDGTRYGVWRSDGLAAGTTLMHDLGSSYPVEILAAQDLLFLSLRGSDGDQLWTSDGTSSGTILVRDFSTGRSCPAEQLTRVGAIVFFNVGIPRYGEELWKTDGSWSGTGIVSDVWPGRDRYPAFDEGCQYGPQNLSVVGDRLYLSTDDGVHGTELWRSDGTEDGTVLVKDILPGPESSLPGGSGGGFSGPFTEGARKLSFQAYDGIHGGELWKTDGTEAGTVLVSDIHPGPEGSFPAGFFFISS